MNTLLVCVVLFSGLLGSLVICSPQRSVAGRFKALGTLDVKRDDASPQQISYYISDYELDHNEALEECRTFFLGRLLTILTREQDEFIRVRLQLLGYGRDQVHTAGRFNADNTEWEWTTTTRPIGYDNWRPPSEPTMTTGSCIQLLGESSSYGWVSRTCTNKHFFVCEIVM